MTDPCPRCRQLLAAIDDLLVALPANLPAREELEARLEAVRAACNVPAVPIATPWMSDSLEFGEQCAKCGGARWCWGYELDDASEDTCNDNQTKYSCDWCCQLDFTFTSPEELNRFSDRLANEVKEALSLELVSADQEQTTVSVTFNCARARALELVRGLV